MPLALLNALLPLLELAGLLGVIALGNAPSIVVRSLGLVVVAAVAAAEALTPALDVSRLALAGLAIVLGIAADAWAATLRTWAWRTTSQGVWGSVIGGLLGLFLFDMPGFVFGTLAGSLAGELYSRRWGGVQVLRAAVGTIMNVWGAAGIKLLLALMLLVTV